MGTAMRGRREKGVRGGRVAIRRPEFSDGREIIEMNLRSKGLQRPWAYPPSDRSSWAAYIRQIESERHAAYLVCLKETGAIAGVISISEIVLGAFRSAYLGYYSGEPYAGRGYMSEGLELVLTAGFKTFKLHRLEANIQPENHRSIALVRRLGFRKEGFSPRYLKIGGRWRDHERWAITAEEWHLPRPKR